MNAIHQESYCHRIVLKFRDHSDFPHHDAREISDFFLHHDIISWKKLLTIFPGIRISKLFTSITPEKIVMWVDKARKTDPAYHPPNFLSYFLLSWTEQINTGDLLRRLRQYKAVELAYILNGLADPPGITSSDRLSIHQEYLNPAPRGVNARYAWSVDGGDGCENVQLIDIEQGWIEDHEDIVVNRLPATGINCERLKDHGTAVLGVILMQHNNKGGCGITPKVRGHIISQWRPDGTMNTADAIMTAIDHLQFGDVLLLEAQTSGTTPPNRLWPVEIEEATYQAIRLATALGIIVIEPAGNGSLASGKGNNMDLFIWRGNKIFNRHHSGFRDSGAIVVAAASSAMPYTRKKSSNYGSRVNCYAWGEHVVTAGSYPRSSGFSRHRYTMNFNGTSSAAAIITGVVTSIQSIIQVNQKIRLGPLQMRSIVSDDLYGTHSANGCHIDKIGVMPDLKKIIDKALENYLDISQRMSLTSQFS